jgi:hypothetical protein
MSMRDQNDGGEQTTSGAEAPAGENRTEVIARLAYEKWRARGCPESDDRRDWFEAEQEIIAASVPQARPATGTSSRKRS